MKFTTLAALALLACTAACDETIVLHTAKDFIQFGNSVNQGAVYRKTTVLLDADIDFAGALTGDFVPIGEGLEANNFQGTFDGQGHTLSNLAVGTKTSNASAQKYYGIFGYSDGATIRNVVIDASCSVACTSDSGKEISVGSIVGYIETYDYPIRIESIVNMATVTFSATNSPNAYLRMGGVVGEFYAEFFSTYVRNCVNFGTVMHVGISGFTAIGGVVGTPEGSYSVGALVQNCLNYGLVVHSGTSLNRLSIGGVVGGTAYLNSTVTNCVSAGLVVSNANRVDRMGAVVGSLYKATAGNCYWDDSINYIPYGYVEEGLFVGGSNFSASTFVLEMPVTVGKYTGSSLVDALNAGVDVSAGDGLSRWVLNRNRATVTFRLNGDRTLLKVNDKIVLLPDLAAEEEGETKFEGWYLDEGYSQLFSDTEISKDTVLYGKWNEIHE